MKDNKYHLVTHSSPEVSTVGEYITSVTSPAFKYNSKDLNEGCKEFLDFEANGKTNRDRLREGLGSNDLLIKSNEEKSDKDKYIEPGTQFAIPSNKVEIGGLITQGVGVELKSEVVFKSEALLKLIQDSRYYRKLKTLSSEKDELQEGVTTIQYPGATVWIYVRSIDKIIDVSKFIYNISISNGQNGGNFNFSLSPIIAIIDETTGSWTFSDKIRQDEYGDIFTQTTLFKGIRDGNITANKFLFHTILNQNDLVFIKFEKSSIERQNFEVSPSELGAWNIQLGSPNNNYDMIGLIDRVPQNIDSSSVDVSITVSGRDLIKLFIEDSVYFYNLENITGNFRQAGTSTAEHTLQRRLAGDNTLYYLNLYQNTSIEHTLKYVIQQLSSIRIIDNKWLESYGNRRNKRFISKNVKLHKEKNESIDSLRKEILSDISEYLEKNQSAEVLSSYDDIQYFFKETQDFLSNKEVLVSNSGILGWKTFTFNKEKLRKNQLPLYIAENVNRDYYDFLVDTELNSIFVKVRKYREEVDKLQSNRTEEFEEGYANGIWQIVRLIIDSPSTKRRIVDSSMSSANGSLLNYIKKICQQPFVEFYTDTYYDQFYLIVRKPPFDKKSIQSYLTGVVETERGREVTSSPTIDIEWEDVLVESLDYDTTSYSWYNFRPQNVYMGGGSILPSFYTPALYFDEYAQIFGAKSLDVQHNYNPYIPLISSEGSVDVSRYEKQALDDLKYIVESHAYLPFTRKGSITINLNRRIKRGSFVRYKPTGEIFHVDNVTHSISINTSSIDSSTTLQVSRGMVERFIFSHYNDRGFTYFDIINTEIETKIKKYPPKTNTYTKTIRVKKDEVREDSKQEDSNKPKEKEEFITISDSFNLTHNGKTINYMLNLLPHQVPKNKFKKLISKWNEMGWRVAITSSYRTKAEQKVLNQRNKKNAKPGRSPHEFGLAIDVNLEKDGVELKFGRSYRNLWINSGVVQVAKSLGMRWGGDFTGYQDDTVHFDLMTKNSRVVLDEKEKIITEDEEYIEKIITVEEQVPGYIGLDIESTLENIKVNPEIFKFFLSRQQLVGRGVIKKTSIDIDI